MIAALVSFVIIFMMLRFLFIYAWPAIVFNGTNFFTGAEWNIGNQYGSGVRHATSTLGPSPAHRSARWSLFSAP